MTMTNLHTIFASLQRYHVATATEPLPPRAGGITWIWANDGVYKRGTDAQLDALIRYASMQPATPGLAELHPYVRWTGLPERAPGRILHTILDDARRCATTAHPVEQQYFVVRHADRMQIVRPPQQADAARIAYRMPEAPVLLDIHSHHTLPAFFSAEDNRDDQGLSVSVVIGRIFDQPEIAVRLNVYGHRNRVPAHLVFSDVGPFTDTFGRRYHRA